MGGVLTLTLTQSRALYFLIDLFSGGCDRGPSGLERNPPREAGSRSQTDPCNSCKGSGCTLHRLLFRVPPGRIPSPAQTAVPIAVPDLPRPPKGHHRNRKRP